MTMILKIHTTVFIQKYCFNVKICYIYFGNKIYTFVNRSIVLFPNKFFYTNRIFLIIKHSTLYFIIEEMLTDFELNLFGFYFN
jgi:hypothetical protein